VKSFYVRLVRAVRVVLRVTGVLTLLDRLAMRSRTVLWVRSWLSVYDLEDLLAFDVPWWTFEAVDRVEAFLATRPASRAFEWGSGASTVWLGRRCGTVISVEHDPAWADRMRSALPGNARLRLVEPVPGLAVPSAKPGFAGLDFTDYVATIDDVAGPLDVIVIDGRAREACLDRAVERLASGGLIVLDNVDRARYREAIARFGQRLDVQWTRGRTPALPYPTRTALISVRPPAARAA
jgi:precorrin-6B methylase 2